MLEANYNANINKKLIIHNNLDQKLTNDKKGWEHDYSSLSLH